MNKKRKKRNYTIMFIPDDNGKTFYYKIGRFFLFSILFFIFIFSISALFYTAYWGQFSLKLHIVNSLQNENENLKNENKKLYTIIEKMKYIEESTNYLHKLVNLIGEESVGLNLNDIKFSDARTNIVENRAIISKKSIIDKFSIPSISPVDGWITKYFDNSNTSEGIQHLGIDFVAADGSLIRATAPGKVTVVENDKYFGLYIEITHKNGFVTKYGHCKQILVQKGKMVTRGQTIALLGNTGKSTSPHVHYEVLINGVNIDPVKYLFDRLD